MEFSLLFDTTDFPARWGCGNWSVFLGWTYIIANVLIAVAYFGIPISISVYFLRRRTELRFPALYALFAAFIFFCGLGHLVDATLFWWPWYRFAGLIHVITATVSLATLFFLIRYLPEAVKLPGALRLSQERAEQISKLEAAKQQLEASEARFRALATNTPLIIFTATEGGAIDYVNPAFSEITGSPSEEAMGDGLINFIYGEDLERFRGAWEQATAAKQPLSGEYRLKVARGEERWFLIKAVPSEGHLGGWIGFAVDITAQKKTAAKQLQLERDLQKNQKWESLGVLAGGVAHDFNNLLTSILGSASLAELSLAKGHPAVKYLEMIGQTTYRAAELCNQMLAYSGKGDIVISHTDVSALVEDTTSLIRSLICENAVIRFELEANLPLCEGDATQLRQVVMNLVINASDSIGPRSGYIDIRTGAIRADRAYLKNAFGAADLKPGDYVYIEVSDNGEGMSSETLSHIFDPFYTTKSAGRGLGLAAVLGIVKGHAGAIRVYSEEGKGTTFKMLIPAVKMRTGSNSPEANALDDWRSEGTLLIVDDKATLRTVVGRLVEHWGFQTLAAGDGQGALDILDERASEIRCVLLDLTMPRMDGEVVFREIRRRQLKIPVILMSGFSEQEATSRFVGRGLAGFIQKPFSPHQLQRVLRKALES